jgi:KOW motif
MQERWDLIEQYPAQLRSFVPLLTTYTDSAFPSDIPTDKGLRVALRYEVGRFFASLERLKQATARRALHESYVAYADMSLHFDRYMRVGGIYTYYDNTISNEPYFKGIPDDALVYSNPAKDPPEVRDLVIVIKGPDKGRSGIVIGIYPDNNNVVVKLDRYKGMREIRVVAKGWVAKRLGEQDPDDVFLIPHKS